MIPHCLADIAGAYYDPAKPFRNWSSLPYYQLDTDDAPWYAAHHQLAQGTKQAIRYLERISSQGYTGIVLDNLAHLVGFEHAPVPIYAPGDPYRVRAKTYRAGFAPLFHKASELGMQVFVTSDMQWSTPPLRQYVGKMTADNPRLAQVNQWALEDLFTMVPEVAGIVIRVGEAGGAHNQGATYTGHMLYTSQQTLRSLIDTLLPVCERHHRLLIVRTWSIGIGELGNMQWSREQYNSVFADYTSPHLLVSIKHTPSDFFRHLPHNPTAGTRGPAQIVEMQNRREYELFGMIPNATTALHREVLHHQQTYNQQFAGIWAWNSTGGWGGGQAALGTNHEGWSIWTEINSAVTAALVHTPDVDTNKVVQSWCEERFGGAFGQAIAALHAESETLIEQGWYIPKDHAPLEQSIGTIYLPSLLWVWWMRPTASLLIWSYLASAVHTPTAIAQSQAACERATWHADHLAALAPADNPQAQAVVASVYYFADVLGVAQDIRTFMLRGLQAAWDNRRDVWHGLRSQAAALQQTLQAHQQRWGDNAHLPPLELDEMGAFLQSYQQKPRWLWVQARVACLVVRRLRDSNQQQQEPSSRQSAPFPLARVLAASLLLIALFTKGRQQRAGLVGMMVSLFFATSLRQRTLELLIPWANRRFYMLPSIFFETGPAFKEWMA
jgi:hypothetical protein